MRLKFSFQSYYSIGEVLCQQNTSKMLINCDLVSKKSNFTKFIEDSDIHSISFK